MPKVILAERGGGRPLACIVVPAGRSACPAARWRGAQRSTKQNTAESIMKRRAGRRKRGVKEGAGRREGPRETALLPGWVPPLLHPGPVASSGKEPHPLIHVPSALSSGILFWKRECWEENTGVRAERNRLLWPRAHLSWGTPRS